MYLADNPRLHCNNTTEKMLDKMREMSILNILYINIQIFVIFLNHKKIFFAAAYSKFH